MGNIRKVKIKEIATFNFGYHTSEIEKKGVMYLQARNFDEAGQFLNNVDNFVAKDNIKEDLILKDGDILLVGKGMRFFAHCYKKEMGEAVASSIFYIINTNREAVLPDYLTCILNHTKSHNYFNSIGAGSSIPSIRKNELADFEINLPSLQVQHKIVEMYDLHNKEIQLLEQLKEKKLVRFNQLINEITK
ncbi:restriction endonuclease subunit S [Chishuiella sp.]|uniref:restriction endonuclease subunit S n=1 Tax=Chishuiella sp. TaxID=1969467 RepID=UPI0028ADAB49|nr:restriction endonuclease subunit S [Chishuiella sp.]